jgi:WD40 repeat protein
MFLKFSCKKLIVFVLAVFVIAQVSEAKELSAGNVVMLRTKGQIAIVLGYDDGSLELRDWAGKLISSRTGLGKITAIDSYRKKNSVLPMLFVASTASGGTLRIIDPAAINKDVVKRTNLGTITALWTWEKWIYVGSNVGIICRLDTGTLATLKSRGGFGEIKYIRDGAWESDTSEDILVASTNSNGTLYSLNSNTLVTRKSRSNFGTIYGLGEDYLDDGDDEIIITSSDKGGAMRILKALDLKTRVEKTGIGTSCWATLGFIGFDQCDLEDGTASLVVAFTNGTIRIWDWNMANGTLTQQSSRNNLGKVYGMGIDDMLWTGIDELGFISSKSGKVLFRITDENLKDLVATDITIP